MAKQMTEGLWKTLVEKVNKVVEDKFFSKSLESLVSFSPEDFGLFRVMEDGAEIYTAEKGDIGISVLFDKDYDHFSVGHYKSDRSLYEKPKKRRNRRNKKSRENIMSRGK